MPFNPNIPQPNDLLTDSQGDLLANNQQLDTSFGINHYAFSDLTANNGKHKYVQMPVQSADPPLSAGVGVLWTLADANGNSQLVYDQDLNGAMRRMQLTAGTLAGTNNLTFGENSTNGWTFLPGNLLLQYGSVSSPGGSGTVVFPIAFKTATTPFSIQLTPRNDGSHSAFTYYIDTAPINTQFGYRGTTTGSNTLYWIAIGIAP